MAVLAVAGAATAEPPQIAAKRAEAQRVLGEINALDLRLERATEAYDAATGRLADIERERALNEQYLAIARRNFTIAQQRLAARLRAIYTASSDPQSSTLAILLGSSSLTDFLNRIQTVHSVAAQDTQVIGEIRRFRHDMTVREAQLKSARARQERLVAERAAERTQIEAGLAERQRLVASIRSEIEKLQAQEAARQARLRAEAEARLQAQLVAQHQQALQAQQNDAVGATAVTPEGVSVTPPQQHGGVVSIAMHYLGVPYVWAGASPSGFDCSGLVQYVFAQIGIQLPHNAAEQYSYGVPVARDQLQPGDLVFFDNLGHVGIYIGNNEYIEAPHTGAVVQISSLSNSWAAANYYGARRI